MDVIIKINNNIIQEVITCKCSSQSWLLYIKKAREMGLDLEEDTENIFCDLKRNHIIQQIDSQLEDTGHQLKWLEAKHIKSVR